LLNILNNAKDVLMDKNIDNAKIVLNVSSNDNLCNISILDNGGGIPDNVINRLGEQYFTTKGESGTGLGLYMSKIIVTQHLNGSLSWKNYKDGACFSISIPIE
jgi:C4-dicarboxylate-specific signal transduction histidine kinase